jgi:hypothetical protein
VVLSQFVTVGFLFPTSAYFYAAQVMSCLSARTFMGIIFIHP